MISDDADVMARATMLSGSYMLFDRHDAGPDADAFATAKYETPNVSGRMDNLRAAILRPQLARLADQCAAWNARYAVVDDGLRDLTGLTCIDRPKEEGFVASSFQFLLLDWSDADIHRVVTQCAARGVELKWFGGAEPAGFTSRYDSWRYVDAPRMEKSDRVLRGILDLRLPLTFSTKDCELIAKIIREEVSQAYQSATQ